MTLSDLGDHALLADPLEGTKTAQRWLGRRAFNQIVVEDCFHSRFPSFWLPNLAVQRCGSGFCGAASSTYVLVEPGFPQISHISAYAAHQGGLVLWYGLGRPVVTPN